MTFERCRDCRIPADCELIQECAKAQRPARVRARLVVVEAEVPDDQVASFTAGLARLLGPGKR